MKSVDIKLEVVVSKYKENLDWVLNIKNHKVVIYNKGDFDTRYINLPNIGREAHTYLYHIIENYDNLENYTCFLQGNPFDHLNIDINNIFNIDNDFYFKSLNSIIKCELDGNPHHPKLDIGNLFDNFFIDKPDIISFSPGAQFIVKRDSILKRNKQFYIDLLNEFNRTDIDDFFHKKNKMPWVMERVWSYIFNPSFKSKYDNI